MDQVELCFSLRQRNARAKAASNKQPTRKGSLPAIRIGGEAVNRMQRHPKVPRSASVYGEFRWRNTDNRERELVDEDSLTDDCRVGGKTAPPILIAQNRDIRAPAIISGDEQAASLRSDAQNGEEIVGVGVALSQSSASVPADIYLVHSHSAKNSGKHVVLLAEAFEMRIAEPAVPVLRAFCRECVCKLNELLRVGHGQPAQHDRVQQTEDSRVRSNAKRQR